MMAAGTTQAGEKKALTVADVKTRVSTSWLILKESERKVIAVSSHVV